MHRSVCTDKTLSASGATIANVKSISKAIDTHLSPLTIFKHHLSRSAENRHSILLESSEIETKADVKSILLLQAALRIECNHRQVTAQSVTANGHNALTHIKQQLKLSGVAFTQVNHQTITVNYPAIPANLDEDSKLKQASPFDFLRLLIRIFDSSNNQQYAVFLAGVFAYDMIACFEDLPPVATADNTCADYIFYLAETLLVMDHKNHQHRLYGNQFTDIDEEKNYFELSRVFSEYENFIVNLSASDNNLQKNTIEKTIPSAKDYQVNLTDSEYAAIVNKLKTHIIDGDIFQVVPSRTFSMPCHSPLASYQALKQLNPSPYMFFMHDEQFCLFGASPESALKYSKKTNLVELYPIAGTRPRGKNADNQINADLDSRIEIELKLDEKELAEHMMLVDLARNDIARISQPGSTRIPRLLQVDRYSQVMHLVSCVQGELREDLDALHAYQACMNMGTLTGAPKIKATQLIRQLEKTRRGSYGGAVGYLNGQGDMDSCIVIRSAFCKQRTAYVQAGAGIVYDSIAELESQETTNKAKAVINAVSIANHLFKKELL